MVIHEYYDWSTLQTEPEKKALTKGITMALKSFKDSDAEIDIGRHLPRILSEMGMKIVRFSSNGENSYSREWYLAMA